MKSKTLIYALSLSYMFGSPTTLADEFVGSVQGYYLNKSYTVDDDVSTDIMGVYTYLGYGKHSIELEADTLSVSDDDISQQDDLTAVYRNYQVPNWRFSLGGHQVEVTNVIYQEDTSTEGDITYSSSTLSYTVNALLLGAQYTNYIAGLSNWLVGIDVISASYNNSELTNFTQFSPYYGGYFALNKHGHYLYAGIEIHAQLFDDYVSSEKAYIAPAVTAKYVANNTAYKITAQFGDNINQFNLGGFSYEGDNVLHTSNVSFIVEHSFSPAFFAKVGIKYQNYISQFDEDESNTAMHVALGYNF